MHANGRWNVCRNRAITLAVEYSEYILQGIHGLHYQLHQQHINTMVQNSCVVITWEQHPPNNYND